MIKKIIFGLMWFVVIFLVIYFVTGVIYVLFVLGVETNQARYEAAQAFRDNYIIFFLVGSLILAIIGTISGILPGTKKKPRAKKKASAKKEGSQEKIALI